MTRRYYWRGGPGASVTIPMGLGAGATSGSPVQVGASRTGFADTLTRVRVQGRFMVSAIGNGTTANPPDNWGLGLEAYLGIWSDGGDTTIPVPSDPFDAPDPDPGWVWTAFLSPRIVAAATVPKSYVYTLDIPPESQWSATKRDTVFAHGGTQQQLWACWAIDAISFPTLGAIVAGVPYESGADIDIRSLWLKG